jgi:hypothetical protein
LESGLGDTGLPTSQDELGESERLEGQSHRTKKRVDHGVDGRCSYAEDERNSWYSPRRPAPEDYACKPPELWPYPDNSMILELSTRCAYSEAFLMTTELHIFLTQRVVDLTGEQATKTKKMLEFFSQRLVALEQEETN